MFIRADLQGRLDQPSAAVRLTGRRRDASSVLTRKRYTMRRHAIGAAQGALLPAGDVKGAPEGCFGKLHSPRTALLSELDTIGGTDRPIRYTPLEVNSIESLLGCFRISSASRVQGANGTLNAKYIYVSVLQ